MPYARVAAVFLLFVCVTSTASAQAQGLQVTVTSPDVPIEQATLFLGNEEKTVRFESGRRATTAFSRSERGPALLSIRIDRAANQLQGKKWETPFNMNGSGHLEYTIFGKGSGQVSQWPLVRWMSSNSTRLDVRLNNDSIGTTAFEKGVEPNKRHQAEWRSGAQPSCKHQFMLPSDATRIFTCNPVSGEVTEK
jgi:hypothetical protein